MATVKPLRFELVILSSGVLQVFKANGYHRLFFFRLVSGIQLTRVTSILYDICLYSNRIVSLPIPLIGLLPDIAKYLVGLYSVSESTKIAS